MRSCNEKLIKQHATRKPRQSPFKPSASTATLDSDIRQAWVALRAGKGAHYALEKYGVEVLFANSDHLTEEEFNDDSINEAIHQATDIEGEPAGQTILYLNTLTLAHSEHAAASMPIPSMPTPSVLENSADLALSRSGRPTFKVNLTPPPRFGEISATSNVDSWLSKIAKGL